MTQEWYEQPFVFPKWANYLLPAIVLGVVGGTVLRSDGGGAGGIAEDDRGGIFTGAAGAVQPCPARGEAGDRLPVLSYDGGEVELRRDSADGNVHELPHQYPQPRATQLAPIRESWATGKPVEWVKVHDLPEYVYFNHQAHVNAWRGLHRMPRADRPDGAGVPGQAAEHGLVPGLPSRSRPAFAAEERGGDGHELDSAERSDGCGRNMAAQLREGLFDSRHGVHEQLFDVSSVKRSCDSVGSSKKQ